MNRCHVVRSALLAAAGSMAAVALLLSASAAGAQPADAVTKLTLRSDVLGEERTILVRTPPGYAASTIRYPVLYLTDGDAQIGHTAATVAFLARNGRMPEMIIVGVTNTDRTRDLTPTKAELTGAGGTVNRFPTAGGADKFLAFFERELIPKIEADYRTVPLRVFAGHSFGGLFATYAAVAKPDLFNAWIAVSPTLFWDDDLPIRKTEEFFRGRTSFNRSLFVTLGSEGEQAQVAYDRYKTLLSGVKASGFRFGSEQFTDEDHGSVVLPSHYAALRFVFDGWLLPRDSTTGTYAAKTVADVKAHYATLAGRLGYAVVPPEGPVNLMGYAAIAEKRLPDAIALLEMNIANYPGSANVYDSLGEALEAAGKLDAAIEQYEKAVAMGEQSNDRLLDTFRQHVTAARAKKSKPSSQQ